MEKSFKKIPMVINWTFWNVCFVESIVLCVLYTEISGFQFLEVFHTSYIVGTNMTKR